MPGPRNLQALLSHGLMANPGSPLYLPVIHSSTCLHRIRWVSMVYTMGEDEQPTSSEAVSMSPGSIAAVTTLVVDIACE